MITNNTFENQSKTDRKNNTFLIVFLTVVGIANILNAIAMLF